MQKGKKLLPPPLAYRAEEALRKAVAEAIDEHRRNGIPIAVWREGKIVRISPDQIMVRDAEVDYSISRKRRT